MHHLRKQVAYIKGLTEGMNLSSGSNEGRIIKNIVDVLDDFSDYIQDMTTRQDEMENYLNSIDDDLYDVEEDVYEPEDESDDLFDYIEAQCPGCNELVCFEADLVDDDDTIEVTCPSCEHIVYVNDGSYDIFHDNQESEQNHTQAKKSTDI